MVCGVTTDGPGSRRWLERGAHTGKGFYAIVPAEFRATALFFDMDATFVEEETLVEIARRCGAYDQVAEVTRRAMAGELDFEQALRERVATLKGHSDKHLKAVQAAMQLTRGVRELVSFAQQRNWPVFLISGGFIQLAGPLAEEMKLTGFAANDLATSAGKFTGDVRGPLVDANYKRDWLTAMCVKHGINIGGAIAIGDGANDAEMMGVAGLAVGFRPKPILYPNIHVCNHTGNHSLLAAVLSYNH
jgi:phosphoserine phosphatase